MLILTSAVGKKYKLTIGLWKQLFMNLPVVFLELNNKAKLVPAFFRTFMKKAYKALGSLQRSL